MIDTHIFLWALSAPEKIADTNREELELLTNTIYVSAVVIAEIMIKASIGKLQIDIDPVEMALASGFEMLDFSGREALLLRSLPFHHKDPFDRMLIAQSLVNKIPIMTDDHTFRSYDCTVIGNA